jgi:surfactin synthase thioesterase subunit
MDATWIRRFHTDALDAASASAPAGMGSDLPKLVCFPHAGGSATFYFPVSRTLRGRFDVLAVQYPGRQDRRHEEPIGSIPVLADHVFAALRPLLGDGPVSGEGALPPTPRNGPVAFFGHSMGAVVAYEVARRMEEAGLYPAALIVSGRRAPSRPRAQSAESIHRRDDDGIIAELHRLSATDASLLADDDVVRMILPAVRSDYRAIESYAPEPGPPLACPIAAFLGDADPQVTVDDARAWEEHTRGEFELRMFRGGHFYLAEQQEETIAGIVDVLMARRGPGLSE